MRTPLYVIICICLAAAIFWLATSSHEPVKSTAIPSSAPQPDCTALDCLSKKHHNIVRLTKNNQNMFVSEHRAKRYTSLADQATRTFWKPMLSKSHRNVTRYIKPKPQHKTCAIVGGSQKLKGSKHGKKIDAHDAVFRMTISPVKGYEEDVGKRTTYRLQWYRRTIPEYEKPVYIYYQNNATTKPDHYTKWLSLVAATFKRMPDKQRNKYKVEHAQFEGDGFPRNRFLLTDSYFVEKTQNIWHGRDSYWLLNAGELATTMALHMCDKVSIFGFTTKENENLCYYYDRQDQTCRFDDKPDTFNQQIQFLQRLKELNLVTIYE